MRVESLRILIAVLTLAASLFPQLTSQTKRHPSSSIKDHPFLFHESEQSTLESRRLFQQEMKMVLRMEGGDMGHSVDCCPSIQEMVEPIGGTNLNDDYVELYREYGAGQRFYEWSCRQDVVGKPCRFLDWRLHNQSRCVQKFSYSYALVKDTRPITSEQRHHHVHYRHNITNGYRSFSSEIGGAKWKLDYIKVRSGCACEVTPVPRMKKKRIDKGKKSKSKRQEYEDDMT